MKIHNIERNKLDYILTDLLPVEISELFSLKNFYNYLLTNKKKVDKAVSLLREAIAKNDGIPFQKGWATAPLKFNILKGNDGQREISLMQPLSMLNIYLFLECYQKELLILLEENAVFSLRYHRKNSNLYYKKQIKKISEYYQETAKKLDKGVLQQTGVYFKISKFNSVASFTESRTWQQLNFKYSNFARMDYKSCFDSIYTHVYKWIKQKNIVDSKNVKNSNLYVTIDRILQNINNKSSNGVIVGPEFSRMIVEILLQQIDVEVMSNLSLKSLEANRDYNVYRYVDDIFIFANSDVSINEIISTITETAQKYLMRPNELKLLKSPTPFTLNNWLTRARDIADKISTLFYSNKELFDSQEEEKYLIKCSYFSIEKIKNVFNTLICDFPNEKRTIVSFMLSTLLNNIGRKKNGINLCKSGFENKAFYVLEFVLYITAFYPCFEHIQKLISIAVYFDDELKFIQYPDRHKKLQKLFSTYSFILERGNLNDLCNVLLFFKEFKLSLSSFLEDQVFEKIKNTNNPILLANFLLYSKYNEAYFNDVLAKVEIIINNNIEHITFGEEMLQIEFWYILIFNNCPFLSENTKFRMKSILDRLRYNQGDILKNLILDFLNSRKNNLFFTWGNHVFNITKQIAFRTHQRSVFRKYKNKSNFLLYGSLD